MIKSKTYKICVFCGSKNGNSKMYIELATKIGEELAKKKFDIIYGGGNSGLMGSLAKAVVKNKGNLISIIPEYFNEKNVLFKHSNKTIFTKDFSERKKIMIKSADIFLILPGGYGTLDELFEILSLNQLKVINKKIILLDINNFWNSLRKLMKDLKRNGFLYTNKNIYFTSSVAKSIKFIENSL